MKSDFSTISNGKYTGPFCSMNATPGGSKARRPALPIPNLPPGTVQAVLGFKCGTMWVYVECSGSPSLDAPSVDWAPYKAHANICHRLCRPTMMGHKAHEVPPSELHHL